ncbi:hypothetical protein D3C73_1108420 [compost metagenome]
MSSDIQIGLNFFEQINDFMVLLVAYADRDILLFLSELKGAGWAAAMVMLGIVVPGEAPDDIHAEVLQQPDIVMREARPHTDDHPLTLQPALDFSKLSGGQCFLLRQVYLHFLLLAYGLPKFAKPVVKPGDSMRLQRRNVGDAEFLLQPVAHISA